MALALVAPIMVCAAAIGPDSCRTSCSQRCICSPVCGSAAIAEI
jgi:hypothetical protein